MIPGRPGSARLDQIPEPLQDEGAVLVETITIGADREILTYRVARATVYAQTGSVEVAAPTRATRGPKTSATPRSSTRCVR